MALAIVEAVRGFVVRHRPTHRLEVINSAILSLFIDLYLFFANHVNVNTSLFLLNTRLDYILW